MNKRRWIINVGVAFFVWFAPASSGVFAQETHLHHVPQSAGVPEVLFQAKMTVPDDIGPGKSFTIDIHISDDKGRKVSAFDVFQEKLMHLIVVSDDLGFFEHLHPEYQGDGHFKTTAILPSAGAYTLFSDYQPAGQKEQISVLKLRMKGARKSSEAEDMKATEKMVQGMRIRMGLSPKIPRVNEEAIIGFYLKQIDGKPVTGLGPYLGEKGHLVIIGKSKTLSVRNYLHAHAMKEGEASEIKFTTRFPNKGLYKLWCQFNRNGRILTADFWVNIQR
jgi:hypothetical protein